MSSYWLFTGDGYCPNGGIADLCGEFETLEAAQADGNWQVAKANPALDLWAHVVEISDNRVVNRWDWNAGEWVAFNPLA